MRKYFAIGTIAVLVACGKDHTPITPSGTAGATTGPVVAISVSGPTTIAPGQTATFTAMTRTLNGTMADVTAQTVWQSTDPSLLSISSTGQAIALAPGESGVKATFGGWTSGLNVIVVPAGTFRLTGQVLESGLGLGEATVDVIGGTGTGLSTVTDAYGRYRLYGVAANVQIRASKDDYAPANGSLFVASHLSLNLAIVPVRQTDITGEYVLVITADSSCTSLPDDARQRRYTARITQTGPRFRVVLSDAVFAEQIGDFGTPFIGNGFSGHVEPSRITFDLLIGPQDIMEMLDDSRRWSIDGSGAMAAVDTGFAGAVSGDMWVWDSKSRTSISCVSTGHQFVLTRR